MRFDFRDCGLTDEEERSLTFVMRKIVEETFARPPAERAAELAVAWWWLTKDVAREVWRLLAQAVEEERRKEECRR